MLVNVLECPYIRTEPALGYKNQWYIIRSGIGLIKNIMNTEEKFPGTNTGNLS